MSLKARVGPLDKPNKYTVLASPNLTFLIVTIPGPKLFVVYESLQMFDN